MKLVILHPDDYAQALAGGMVPFDVYEDRSGDKIRIAIDHYVDPEKGTMCVFDISALPPWPSQGLVFLPRKADA